MKFFQFFAPKNKKQSLNLVNKLLTVKYKNAP